jgi:hypothetical protein
MVITYLLFLISNYGTFKSCFLKRHSTRPLNLLFQFPQILGIYQIVWEDAYNWKITNEIIMFKIMSFLLAKKIIFQPVKYISLNDEEITYEYWVDWVQSVLMFCFVSHYDMLKLQLLV